MVICRWQCLQRSSNTTPMRKSRCNVWSCSTQFAAPVMGRPLGEQPVPRLIWISCTRLKSCLPSTKTMSSVYAVAMNGIHKLPYHCMIYTDGCGSMVHVEAAAVLSIAPTSQNHIFGRWPSPRPLKILSSGLLFQRASSRLRRVVAYSARTIDHGACAC